MTLAIFGGRGLSLPEALVEIERELSAQSPGEIAVRGWDDEALAAALVAAKLLVEIRLEEPGPEPADAAQGLNRRIIRLLATPEAASTLSTQ